MQQLFNIYQKELEQVEGTAFISECRKGAYVEHSN